MYQMWTVCLLFAVTLLNPLGCYSQLGPKYIQGSLSKSVNVNCTLMMKALKGVILHMADYERNIFMVTIDNGTKANISIKYNAEYVSTDLMTLCGCDPCGETMTNLYVTILNKDITVNCNRHSSISVRKLNIANRTNKRISKDFDDTLDSMGSNKIYAVIPLNEVGCLESFYFNDHKIIFVQNDSKFLSQCQRDCRKGDCNGGQCQPRYSIGPLCDCAKTGFPGPYCNASLIPYVPGSTNEYSKTNTTSSVHISLLWRSRSFNKRYCLLTFVNEYGHVTFSAFESVLMKGSDLLTKIDFDRVNYLDVLVTSNDVLIKVNDYDTNAKPNLLGKLSIRVGYSENLEKCDTFEGSYYFHYNSSQVLPAGKDTNSSSLSQISLSHLDLAVIAIVVGVVTICGLSISVCYLLSRKPRTSEVTDTISLKTHEIGQDAESGFYERVKDDTSYDYVEIVDPSQPQQ